jgi:dihydroorotate dehydrogenase (fumarate)
MRSKSGAFVTKSCTELPRDVEHVASKFWPEMSPSEREAERAKVRYHYDAGAQISINASALINDGFDAYLDRYRECRDSESSNKPFILSIAAIDVTQTADLVKRCHAEFGGIRRRRRCYKDDQLLIELNVGCPNVHGSLPLGYDFYKLHELLQTCTSLTDIPIGVKLPPYLVQQHAAEAAFVLRHERSFVSFVTTTNSLGNGYVALDDNNGIYLDDGDDNNNNVLAMDAAIQTNNGFGGIGGSSTVKAVGLGNVRMLSTYLPYSIPIIGCGGIRTQKDAVQYLLAGASLVQVGTHLIESNGPEPTFESLLVGQ